MVSVPVVLSSSLFQQSSPLHSLSSSASYYSSIHSSLAKGMETTKEEGKRVPEYDDEGEDDEDTYDKKEALTPSKRRASGSTLRSCQAEDCTADMTDAKAYHRRHKVCEFHAKAAVVVISGSRQRFCQQCSRFHELSEFDEAKRSCRRRLAGHNERRRKSAYDSH